MHDLEVKKISFVGSPANKRKFLLFKSEEKENQPMPSTLREILEAKGLEGDELEAALKVAKSEAPTPEPDPTVADLRDQMKKQHDEGVALRKELAESKEEVAKEKEIRLKAEFDAETEKYPFVGLEKDAFSSILRKVKAAVSDEEYKQFESVLKQSNEVNKKSDLFKEKGGNGANLSEGGESAYDIVLKKAEKLVENGKADNIEDAKMTVFKENDSLYNQHINETTVVANAVSQGGN
jgi:hypothetical protein